MAVIADASVPMDKSINLHIVRNSVLHDSRVLRETAALHAADIFDEVEIAGFEQQGVPEREDLDGRRVWRVAIRSRKLPKDLLSLSVKFFEWRLRIVKAYRRVPVSVIHCHDLEPLPIAVRLKRLTGARIVYDAHELETERVGSAGAVKFAQKLTERRCIPWVDAVITVSPSIQQWYRKRYPQVPVALVRNVPPAPAGHVRPADLRGRLGVPEGALLFIYLGGHTSGRGIPRMLEAFSRPSMGHHAVFVGAGPLASDVQRASERAGNIHWLPPVPPSSVLETAAGADVGLSMIEDVSLSYRYCLPNKLFEYWAAGIPAIVSRTPDQVELVERYGAGWPAPADPAAFDEMLQSLGPRDVESVRGGVQRVREELCWEREAQELLAVYRNVLASA